MESLHYLLMKAHSNLSRYILLQAAALSLTPGQPKVLDFLQKVGEADQKTIAAYCEIEPATAGSILLRMEQAGLIVRRQKPGNRRSLFVSLTEKGTAAAQAMDDIFHQAEEKALAGWKPEDIQTFKTLLSQLCATFPLSDSKEES